jgi:molybdopterin converting factor small subunit
MPVRILLPAYLRPYAAGRQGLEVEGAPGTVREALLSLRALHPGVIDRVLTERGEVRRHVNIFVGDESIRWTGGLDTPLPEGSEIAIVPAVSGG